MDDFNLGYNLEQLMKMHGDLSVSELARKTQVPQPTLHHILNGVTKKPRKQALEALAKFFSVSIPQLTGAIPLAPILTKTIKETLKITSVPIIEWEMLNKWPVVKNYSVDLKEIIIDKKVDQHSFAILMKDSSMEPMFPMSSLLVFDYGKLPKDR